MATFVRVRVDRFRDVRGRFAAMTNEAAAVHVQEHVRAGAEMLKAALRAEAPVGKPDPLGRPRRYPPLAQNIGYEIRRSGRGWRASFGGPPQARWVIGGTRPHPIPRTRLSYPLRFFWARMGKVCYFWAVQHPGTTANRFDVRALQKVEQQMSTEIGRGALAIMTWLTAGGKF